MAHTQPNNTATQKSAVKTRPVMALLTGICITLLLAVGCNNSNPPTATRIKSSETTAPIYNTYQQLFCLNMLSNVSSVFPYSTVDSIANATVSAVDSVLANPAVIGYMGHWQCVWGPVVLINQASANTDTPAAANTMYVAKNLDSPSLYVIAIAGTNPNSRYALINEDADVYRTRAWSKVLKNIYDTSTLPIPVLLEPFISRATYRGLYNLWTMKDYTRHDTTLLQFLRSLPTSSPINIWTTGHSLGGALAPTLALYIKNIKTDSLRNNQINVNCLAVAGATPGDRRFSNYYNTDVTGGPAMGQNTIRVWNSHDVVPHGYETDMMAVVDTIYDADTMPVVTPRYVKDLVYGLIKGLNGLHYNYTQLYPAADTVFTSAFYSKANAYSNGVNPPTKTNTDTFWGQVLCQHIPSYPHYFQVDSFQYLVMRRLNLPAPFFSYHFNPAPILNVQSVPVPNLNSDKK